MQENRVKCLLKNDSAVLGTWLNDVRSPAVVVAIARGGLDMVIIDLEHSLYNLETVQDFCVVAREVGLCPIVRVPEVNRSLVGRVLDGGALGVMVPRVKTRAEVETFVAAARFPPRGVRGFSLGLANTRYRWVDLSEESLRAMDEEILIVVQIEEQAALENLDDILAVDGVDVAFVGPADLSISLGAPGQDEHPRMREAVAQVLEASKRRGIAAGIACDASSIERHLKEGARFLAFGGDLYFIQDACRRAMQDFRRLTGRSVNEGGNGPSHGG